jgi:hypothetical protein
MHRPSGLLTADGLPLENIYSVLEDQDRNIWFGAWPDYLIRYTNGKFFPEQFDLVTAPEDRAPRLPPIASFAFETKRNGSASNPSRVNFAKPSRRRILARLM